MYALELRSLPLTHTWKRSGKGWCAIIGKTYGGLLSNTYKFAPRKVQQSRDFGSSGALFGTEKLSGKILLYSIRDICNLCFINWGARSASTPGLNEISK